VGFKFSLGHPWEFFGICKAMLETGIRPDFIVVDGGEGGTGAAPMEFTDHIGKALLLVHNTLTGLNLRDEIRLGASGKIISAFDIARTMALGADWCNAALAVSSRCRAIPAAARPELPRKIRGASARWCHRTRRRVFTISIATRCMRLPN
jgi:glutamate synthase domain-containing protein 2